MFALAIKQKNGNIEFVGAFSYRTIEKAVEAIPQAEKNRESLRRDHPEIYFGPIVGVVDRKHQLVWKRPGY